MKHFTRWLLAGLLLLASAMAPMAPARAAPVPLLSTTITATGGTGIFYLQPNQQAVLFLAGGTATVQVEESPDGITWYKITPAGTQIYVYALSGDNQSDILQGSASGVVYRFNCTSFTSSVSVTVLPQLSQ